MNWFFNGYYLLHEHLYSVQNIILYSYIIHNDCIVIYLWYSILQFYKKKLWVGLLYQNKGFEPLHMCG